MNGDRPQRPEDAPEIPDAVWDLLQSCWKNDRTERPKATSVRQNLRDADVASALGHQCFESTGNFGADKVSHDTLNHLSETCKPF